MTFAEWISDYPFIKPCIYCFYFRAIGTGQRFGVQWYYRHSQSYFKETNYAVLPACHYGIYHHVYRGPPPVEGHCPHFKAIKNYKHLEKELKK